MRCHYSWIAILTAACLTACQSMDPVGQPTQVQPDAEVGTPTAGPALGAANVDLGTKTGAAVTVSLRQRFATAGAPPIPAAFLYRLRDSGTNAIVGIAGGFIGTVTFSNVPAGTYYAQVDALDALSNSLVVGGAQNSTNQVTVTGGTATYSSGFSLTTSLQLIAGTGGSVPIAITNPYAGGYGELINNATGALISQYDSGTSSFHLQQVVDGTYRFWGMGRSGGYATLARQAANVTVSGNGGSVSGSWNLNIPNLITTIAGGGGSALANGLAATGVSLPGSPADVAYDASGNLFAIVANRVIMVPRTNNTFYGIPMTANAVYTIAGGAGSGSTGDGGPATAALLSSPLGLAVDGAGNVYVADSGNNRIRMVNTAGTISLVAGTLGGGFGGDGGAATVALLSSPQGVGIVGGTLYVADTGNNRIRTISGGTINTLVSGLNTPHDLSGDAQGNLVIADRGNNRVVVYAPVAGTYYNMPMAASSLNAIAALAAPSSVAVDAGGHVYIGSLAGVTIRAIDGTLFSVVGGGGGGADGVAAGTSSLGHAAGVALSPINGGLAIADYLDTRVRFIN
jgi:hypothetical protein